MSQLRLMILCSLCVFTKSLKCYDCTGPKNLFCYPFVTCEVDPVKCTPKVILNTEAFKDSPPTQFSCLKLDYYKQQIYDGVDALKKCIGIKPDYNYCNETPFKPTDEQLMPKCYVCNEDLCNLVSKTQASLGVVASFIFFCNIWWLLLQ